MAAPTYVDGFTTYSLTGTAVTLTIPAGAQAEDLILVFCKQSQNIAAELWDDDGGGGNGYTLYEQHRSTGGRDQETAVYWKIHDGSESNPTFTWGSTASPIVGIMLIYRGVDQIEPIEQLSWMWAENDCNPPNPEVTTTNANNRIVVFHAATHDDISSVGAPTGYTIREYQYGGSAGHTQDHADAFSADAEIDTIGAYTPPDWTHGASNTTPEYHTYTVLLREPVPIHLVDCNTDEIIDLLETGCVATGDGFGTSQGTNGKVELWNDISGTTKVAQTVTTWASDTSITFTAVTGGLSEGWNFLVVTNDSLEVSSPLQVWYGDVPWSPSAATDSDLYWRMDGDYEDEGNAGDDKPFNAVQRGNFSFASVPLTISSAYSWYVEDETAGSEPANSDYTNVTNTHTYRNIGGFVRIEEYQKTPAVIYEEGGGVNNIYFLMLPNGWLVANVADSGGTPDFKFQSYSDFPLITGRPYHIMIATQFGDHFQIYIDGELQTTSGGGDLGSDTTMSTHSGDWSFGDPGANLDTGGVDIAYNACNPMYMAHWGTWSGVGGGAPLTLAEIRDTIFREGALQEHNIASDTEANMQTAMEAYDSQTHADWPLTFDIQPVTGGGDLTLTLTDQVWPDECKFHIRWKSEVATDDLTIRNSGTSNFDSSKFYSKDGGDITVIETAQINITVKDISDSSDIVGARVLVEADTGGSMSIGTDIISGVTDSNGEISAEIDYTTSQPITGYVRSASGATKYKQSTIVATVGANGVDLTIYLIRDE